MGASSKLIPAAPQPVSAGKSPACGLLSCYLHKVGSRAY